MSWRSSSRTDRRLVMVGGTVLVLAGLMWAMPWATREFCVWRGTIALTARDDQRALIWLNRAVWIESTDAQVHYLLARTYRHLKQFDKVEFHLMQAHKLGWDVKQLEYEQWQALAQTGQYESMQEHWSELFTHAGDDGPEISNAYVQWCLSRFGLNDAIRALDAWQLDFPHDAQPHYLRGLLNEALLNWDLAIREHRMALELDPSRNDCRFRLAECLMHRLQVREAEEAYRVCVETDPAHGDAAVGWGKALLKLGQLELARDILTRQVQVESPTADALYAMGHLEWMTNHPAESLRYLEPACRMQPENTGIHYALGRALQATGKRDEAKEHFEFVNAARQALDKLGIQMEQLVRRPEDTALRYTVAMTTWKYKSRTNGAKWLLSLLEFDPHHVPTHAALAEHYALLGDTTRAERYRRQAGAMP